MDQLQQPYVETDIDSIGEKEKASTNILIGYGGFAKIFNNFTGIISNIHVTNANISLQFNRPMQSFMWSPRDNKQIAQVITSVGTAVINGSISFDFSKKLLTTIFTEDFLCRNRSFDLILSDGNNTYMASECYWNSFNISANPHSLVTGNISFMAMNRKLAKIGGVQDYKDGTFLTKFRGDQTDDSEGKLINIKDSLESQFNNITDTPNILRNQLVAYWEAGFNMIEGFSININQNVQPIYLNNPYMMPSYFRCGELNITAQINTWYDWVELLNENKDLEIKIAQKSIKINNKVTQSMQFTQNGAGQIGSHNYTVMGSIDEMDSSYGVKLFEIS